MATRKPATAQARVTRVLVFVAVLLFAIVAFAQFLRRTSMFFPSRYPEGRWDVGAWTIVPEAHRFRTDDGVTLHAWLFRAKAPDAPLIVWCHGNAGNLTDRAEMASQLAERGVSVFVFDWRGFGKSEGSASENALFHDVRAAFDYARQQLRAQRIIVYGESIGGPYAAYVAKERKGLVRGVVIENSFPSLRELGNALYAPLPLGWTAPFALRTTAWLNDAGVPVLVMHGKRDQVIPYRLGRKLFDELRVPKTLLTSETANHAEIPAVEGERYYEAVTAFAKR
ncbi:MAG: alpha/beta fold hydrolase [Acidobacteria bacterium]|nr:alpha/beta fold hydrolase [Acidobacteriota bacterium]MBV9477746.1 alpha/beta fold hydrolase [Acidobacteriota bacterium]